MVTPKDRNEKVDGFVIVYIAVSEEIDGEGLGRYLGAMWDFLQMSH